MQNALIKKQLEGQRQRYLQKQQHVVMSADGAPQPLVGVADMLAKNKAAAAATAATANMTSTPASNNSSLNPAFTPTSVIRKMANDKMEGKEKQSDEDGVTTAASASTPVMRLMSDMSSSVTSSHMPRESRATTSISYVRDSSMTDDTGVTLHSDSSGNISIPVPRAPHNTPQTPVSISRAVSDYQRHASDYSSVSLDQVHSHIPPVSATSSSTQHSLAANKSARPLVGQGAMNNALSMSLAQQLNHMTAATTAQQQQQPDIGNLQRQHSNQTVQQQMAHMQQQHLIATSQQAAHANAQMMNALGGQQRMYTTASQLGRPIIKAAQPGAVNTISPPAFREGVDVTAATGQPAPTQAPVSALGMHRPIVGSGGMAGMKGVTGHVSQDSVRLAEQARLAQMQAQLLANANYNSPYAAMNMASVGGSSANRMGMDMQNRVPYNQQVVNALFMQRMAHPHTATAQGMTGQQLAALQAAQLAQQQQRSYQQAMHNTPQGRGIHGQGASSSRPLSPLQQHAQAQLLASLQQAKHDPSRLGRDGLSKFFCPDLLKQQMTAMPALPSQGQSILTVEEIERQLQQAVTN